MGVSWVARNKRAALSRVQQQALLREEVGGKKGKGVGNKQEKYFLPYKQKVFLMNFYAGRSIVF